MKRSLIVIFLLMLIPLALPAYAIGDYIAFTQTSSGAVSAVLSGSVDPCHGSNILPSGVSSLSLSGNQYDITSEFLIVDPPPLCSPFPYTVSMSLGTVPDGQYTVVWTAGPLVVRGAFSVSAGLLQISSNPVPTLDLSAMLFLITLVATAAFVLRRQYAW
jgi:hypothetical protein